LLYWVDNVEKSWLIRDIKTEILEQLRERDSDASDLLSSGQSGLRWQYRGQNGLECFDENQTLPQLGEVREGTVIFVTANET